MRQADQTITGTTELTVSHTAVNSTVPIIASVTITDVTVDCTANRQSSALYSREM